MGWIDLEKSYIVLHTSPWLAYLDAGYNSSTKVSEQYGRSLASKVENTYILI